MKLAKLYSAIVIAAFLGSAALCTNADAKGRSYVRMMKLFTRKAPARTPSLLGIGTAGVAGTVVEETVYNALKPDDPTSQQEQVNQCKKDMQCKLELERNQLK